MADHPSPYVPDAVPMFCIRYQTDRMAHSKPVRLTYVCGNSICAGRPLAMDVDQECRLLLYCHDPQLSMWVDACVTTAPDQFSSRQTLRGLRLLGQGRFQLDDYLDAVSKSLMKFFGAYSQFQEIDEDDCRVLSQLTGTRELGKSEVLYHQQDHSPDENDLYIVTDGSMKAFKSHADDEQDNIAAISKGQMLGEMSFVTDQPHSASIAALMHAWLIQVSRSGMKQLEHDHPRLYLKIYKFIAKTLVRRLARTTNRWKSEDP